jgi:hypothetical protein
VTRRRGPVVGAALAAAGLLATSATSASGATAPGTPRITRSVRATSQDQAPARTYSDPYVVADPANPKILVAATIELRDHTCHLLRSTDAGLHWAMLDVSPSPSAYPLCSINQTGMQTQTPMAWGRNGELYLAMNGWDYTDNLAPGRNLSVVVARSDDLGDTWTSAMALDARKGQGGLDKAQDGPVSALAVDSQHGSQDIVYVAWGQSYLRNQLAVSTDGGQHFSGPVDLADQYHATAKSTAGDDVPILFARQPQLAVDGDGTLYVLGVPKPSDANANVGALSLVIGRSTDQGRSFSFNSIGPPNKYGEFVEIMKWSPLGGPKGTLHIIEEDKPDQPATGADRDIYYFQSTDGGLTATKPVKLNDDDPAKLAGQFTPNISVGPNGRLDAAWWDFRNDPGLFQNDVYGTSSVDNGTTWSGNIRVSDHSIPRRWGTWSNGFDTRSAPGLASTADLAAFAWSDTRLANDEAQAQDVFAADVQYRPVGRAGPSGGSIVAAALVGLILAGGLLTLSARRSRKAG